MATGDGTNYTSTPLMGLRAPRPGVCGPLGVEPAGYSWMELQNASFFVLDTHNHSPGSGAPIPAAGINLNDDLPFNGNDAIGLRSTRYSPVALASLGVSDLGCLIVSGVDLYYVDGNGNKVRLTSGGGVAGAPGSIGGLVSPAAATYTPASKLFAFTSSSGIEAYLACGPISINDPIANGKAATISVPSGLASSYALILPTALPAATKPLTLSSTGQIATSDALSISGALSAGSVAASGAVGAAYFTGASLTGSSGLSLAATGATAIMFLTNGATAGLFDANGALSMNSHVIYSLATPTSSDHAANKGYVDGLFNHTTSGITPGAGWNAASALLTRMLGWTSASGYITVSSASAGATIASWPLSGGWGSVASGTVHVGLVVRLSGVSSVLPFTLASGGGGALTCDAPPTWNVGDTIYLNGLEYWN